MRVTAIGQDDIHEIKQIQRLKTRSSYFDVIVDESGDDADRLQNMSLQEAVVTVDDETTVGKIVKWDIGFGKFAFRVEK